MKLYCAYGSNINVDQMNQRCPDNKISETIFLSNYRLVFKGKDGQYYATLIKEEGCVTPAILYEVSSDDEMSLDKYEELGKTYYKESIISFKNIDVFLYLMMEDATYGVPSEEYFERIKNGYKHFKLDTGVLDEALEYSRTRQIKRVS